MENYPNQTSQIFSEAPLPTYAGFWRRFVAYMLDGIILSIPGYFIGMLMGYNMFSGFGRHQSFGAIFTTTYISANLVTTIINWLYFALQESGPAQATLGKRALGVKVIGGNGQRITFMNATGRYFGKIVSAITLLVGFMMAGWDSRKQALHDKMANTFVIKE